MTKVTEKATEVYRQIEERCVTCPADGCREAAVELIEKALLKEREEERERCAKVAESHSMSKHFVGSKEVPCDCVHNGNVIKVAAAIRKGGDA